MTKSYDAINLEMELREIGMLGDVPWKVIVKKGHGPMKDELDCFLDLLFLL